MIRFGTAGAACTLTMVTLAMAQSQPAPAGAAGRPAIAIPAFSVAVTSVSESRNVAGNQINIELTMAGHGLPPGTLVRRINVTRAVDDADRPISPPVGRGGPMMPGAAAYVGRGTSGNSSTLVGRIALESPLRDAKTIKFLEGTVELLVPTEANGGIVRIANIKAHSGRLEHPALARSDVVFHFLGNAASAQEVLSPSGRPSTFMPDSITSVGYFYIDPGNRLAAYELQDSDGRPFRTNVSGDTFQSGTTGRARFSNLPVPLPDDAQLVLYLAVPEALKTLPFRVEEIELP